MRMRSEPALRAGSAGPRWAYAIFGGCRVGQLGEETGPAHRLRSVRVALWLHLSFFLACLLTYNAFIHSFSSLDRDHKKKARAPPTEKQGSDELPRASKTAVKLVSSFGLGLARLRIRRDHPIFGRALVALSYVRQMRRTRTCSQHISKVGLGLW